MLSKSETPIDCNVAQRIMELPSEWTAWSR